MNEGPTSINKERKKFLPPPWYAPVQSLCVST